MSRWAPSGSVPFLVPGFRPAAWPNGNVKPAEIRRAVAGVKELSIMDIFSNSGMMRATASGAAVALIGLSRVLQTALI